MDTHERIRASLFLVQWLQKLIPADTHLNFAVWLANTIHSYGYIVILVGTIFEGETALVLGGTAAHLGYLDLRWVILTAWAAALFSDQTYFLCGRYYGRILRSLQDVAGGKGIFPNVKFNLMGRPKLCLYLL